MTKENHNNIYMLQHYVTFICGLCALNIGYVIHQTDKTVVCEYKYEHYFALYTCNARQGLILCENLSSLLQNQECVMCCIILTITPQSIP